MKATAGASRHIVFLLAVLPVLQGCSRGQDGPSELGATPPRETAAETTGKAVSVVTNKTHSVPKIVANRKRYVDSYSMLKEQAELGNASAAFQLYQDMTRCVMAEVRQQALETLAANSSEQGLNSSVVAELAEDQKVCAGLSDEQLATREFWVTKAARLGHVQAQVAYFSVATERFDTPQKMLTHAEEIVGIKSEALTHLSSAASTGDRTALFNLANAYYQGSLSRRDQVKAYAYMRVLQQRGGVQSVDEYLDLWRREMTPEQLRNAEVMAAGTINRRDWE